MEKLLEVAKGGGLEGVDPYDRTAEGATLYLRKCRPQAV